MTAPDETKLLFDTYTIKARFRPILLVGLPLILAILSWFIQTLSFWSSVWGIVWSLIVWCGGAALLAQFGRDFGKKKENYLFDLWGSKPTTRLLRHRDATNRVILARRHNKLQQLIPEVKIPTYDEEKVNPRAADQVYETCVSFLITRTRNHKRFPLIFEENCNYGFRRNLWGMKAIGISLTIVGFAGILILTSVEILKDNPVSFLEVTVIITIAFILLAWLFMITTNWVKIAADAYAERLLEACDDL